MEAHSPGHLQSHSLNFIEMAFRTDRHRIIHTPDGYGKKTRECGDTVEIFIRLHGSVIQSVSFTVNGCLNTLACANAVAELAEGKTVETAWEITPEMVAGFLETLPPEHLHSAELVIDAFHLALINTYEIRRSPWKKMYPRRMGSG
jgi:nitrogen fixation NifU-like protein